MFFLAETMSDFFQRHRMGEVQGLFVLFVVGIMLLSEGAHLGHIALFGQAITPITKATF
ncbi:MAG: hypothetical protein K0U93_24625 [Gammaproteobacteria bacterium]|nr:hypothetical protein [Gammaproteobacteria bacterium]